MRKRVLYFLVFVVLTFGLVVFLSSCGSTGGKGEDFLQEYIEVMGMAKMLVGSKALSDPSTANAVIPAWYELGAWQFGDTVAVGSDGYFSVELPADSDRCMILLVDTTQTKKIDQIVGYVAIGIDSAYNMLNFPASKASGDIDLGEIDQDPDQPDEVKSDENNVNSVTANLSLSLEELKQMASNDKLLRSIKNWYANNHGEDWYGLNPVYMYTYSDDFLSSKDQYLTPDVVFSTANSSKLLKEYIIMYFTTVAADDPTKPEFGDSELSLYFPVGSYTIDAQDQDGNTGINIDGSVEVRLSTDPSLNQPASLKGYRFWDQNGLGFFHDVVPEGQWVLEKDGLEIARYDLSTGDPFDANGNIRVFVPAIKINTTNDTVDSIDIQWYLYDEINGEYQTVEPTSKAFLDVVDYFEISLTRHSDPVVTESFEIGSEGGTVGGNLQITDTHITPTKYEWTVGTATGDQVKLDSLCVQYGVYGTGFMFDFR